QQDRLTLQLATPPRKRVSDVLEPPQAVMTHLGRRWTRTYQLSGRSEELAPPAQLVGQQLGLVVAPLTKARSLQRDGDHPAGAYAAAATAARREQKVEDVHNSSVCTRSSVS